jgi:hypothetical protein
VRAAAGPGGAATVAFLMRRNDPRTHGVSRYVIAALRRGEGGTFPAKAQSVDVVAPKGFVTGVALAADEDGQTTVAWTPERFGADRRVGVNGVTSGVRAAVAGAQSTRFAAARDVEHRGTMVCDEPSVAGASGRAVVAWSCHDKTAWVVRAATTDGARPEPASTVMTSSLNPRFFYQATPVTAGIDGGGVATVMAVRPDPHDPAAPAAPTVERVLAATGR